MAYLINREHFVPFLIVTTGNVPVTGLTKSDFGMFFLQDLSPCSLNVTITEVGGGFYVASYTPTVPAFYYLNIYNTATAIRIEDKVEIDSSATQFGAGSFILLTQDYGSTGTLIPQVPNPNTYILNIYTSVNWNLGNTGSSYVVASTELDTSGNWLTSPLTLLPNTYHLVLQNTAGVVIVFRPYLNLTV